MAEVLRRLDAQDRRYAERSNLDDQREERASREREMLLERVDTHGKRVTIIETRFDAFFGEQGAFRLVCKKIDESADTVKAHGKYIFIGVGVIMAGEFLVPILLKAWGVK